MRRREFLKSGGLAAAALAPIAARSDASTVAPQASGATIKLKLVTPWAPSSSGLSDDAHRLARHIERVAGQRVAFEFVENSDHPPFTDDETVYVGFEQDKCRIDAAFGYFSGLPGASGLEPPLLVSWLSAGGGADLWDELSADHGLKTLAVGHTGPAPALWVNRTITSLADCAGWKVRAEGLSFDVVIGIGATAVANVRDRDICEALNAGRIDATEFGGIPHALAAGIARNSAFAYTPGLTSAGSVLSATMTRRTWSALPPDLQQAVSLGASEIMSRSISDALANAIAMRDALSKAKGVRFASLPRDVENAIARVSEAVVADYAGRDSLSRRINRSYMAFREATATRTLSGLIG